MNSTKEERRPWSNGTEFALHVFDKLPGVQREKAMSVYEYGLFKLITAVGIGALGFLIFTICSALIAA